MIPRKAARRALTAATALAIAIPSSSGRVRQSDAQGAKPLLDEAPAFDETPAMDQVPPAKKRPHSHWKVPAAGESRSGDPEIIFTFDDGPHERYTAKVLDILAEHHVEAMFFWVGRRVMRRTAKVGQRRELVRRAIREGHIVSTHGVDHLHMCTVPKRLAASEIDRSDAAYRELTGMPMVFFRVPYGSRCKRMVRMLAERGLTHLHWDIDPMEWTDHDSARVTATLKQKLRQLRGRAVVLMHDTQPATVKALPKVLEFIETENARRRQRGRRPIRILSGSDLASERLDPGVVGWVHDISAAARARLGGTLSSFVP